MKQGFWLLILLSLIGSGCSDSVKYHVGFVTREVKGTIDAPYGAQPLILVRMHVATFAKTSKGQVQQARAKLVYPRPDGTYLVYMDDNVTQVELYFIAHGYKVAHSVFERTLGVQAYQFDVKLQTDPDPKNGYYHSLKPLLTQYIVEPRFQMPPKDQMALGNWMNQAEEHLYPMPQRQP